MPIWNSTSYPTADRMYAAIAYEWMTAGGLNSPATIDDMIADGATPEQECRECIDGWRLDRDQTIMRGDIEMDVPVIEDFSEDALLEAFRAFFAKRPDRPEDDDAVDYDAVSEANADAQYDVRMDD